MVEPEIRTATLGEAEALAAVYRSAYRENRLLGFPAKAGHATADTVTDWIRDDRVFVATVNRGREGNDVDPEADPDTDELVGGVRLETTDPDRVKLGRLGVHEDWKGNGIGTALAHHAEAWAREAGNAVVWLTTPGDHPYLPEFYRRRGYEQTGHYPLEYRNYDEIVMEKRLR